MILKNGNKIIRNLGGDIITQSDALVDLRSTYGVTKDGSNLVSKIKSYGNRSKLYRQTDPTYQFIENGNGFEMPTTGRKYVRGSKFNTLHSTDDWTIRFKFNTTTFPIFLREEILKVTDSVPSTGIWEPDDFDFLLRIGEIGGQRLTIDLVYTTDGSYASTGVLADNICDTNVVWSGGGDYYVVLNRVNGRLQGYLNGVNSGRANENISLPVISNKYKNLLIGNIPYYDSALVAFDIYNFQIFDYAIYPEIFGATTIQNYKW